jgi:ferric-dicitrate binding protein FerR (iron transport regulator)
MSNSITDIEILIAKSVSGNISLEEAKELENWKSSSNKNLSIYNHTLKAWNKAGIYIDEKGQIEDKIKIHKEINKHLQFQLVKTNRRNFIYKIAAILALPLALAISWYFLEIKQNSINQKLKTEIMSPKGNISKCILPDGTEVWINAASSISYDPNRYNSEIREINLKGEAYFSVTGNVEKPFRVTTDLGCVCVTGTEFNVSAYPGSKTFETVLSKGSVILNFYTNNQQEIKLVPGERAIYDSNKNEVFISNVDSEMFSSWRNGEIIFKDATLNDLIKELERIYDIKFYLEDKKLGEYRFRGMFSYNNNLIDALEKIKKTAQLDYNINNKEVKLKRKN